MLWGGKIFGVHFQFIAMAGLALSFGCPFQVFFTTCFVFFQSNFTKFNLSCLVSCSVSEMKNHIARASTSGSWTPNWFSSKMRSTSSFVRATVAFGLFPLPCFLSSLRLDFRTSLDTFVLEDVYFRVVVIQESLDTSREGGHCVRFVF